MLGIDRFGRAVGGQAGERVVEPPVAAGREVHRFAGVSEDQHAADAGAGSERLIDSGLDGQSFRTAALSVGGDEDFGRGIADARGQTLGAEAAEHDAVDRSYAGAGKHGHGQFRHHRQVQADPVARPHPFRPEQVRKAAHLRVQFAVGQLPRGFCGVVGFPNKRHRLPPFRQVPVEAVFGDVQLPAGKPLHPRRFEFPLQHLLPRPPPNKLRSFFSPKSLRIRLRPGACVQVLFHRPEGTLQAISPISCVLRSTMQHTFPGPWWAFPTAAGLAVAAGVEVFGEGVDQITQ